MRRTDENEDAKIDAVLRQQARRRIESRKLQPLVQSARRLGMNRLESYGDLQAAAQRARECQRLRTDRVDVRLDGHGGKRPGERRQPVAIRERHGPAVEEVAGVVQLQSIRLWRRVGIEHFLNL